MSAGFSIGLLVTGAASSFTGYLVARFGSRKSMVLGTLLGTLGVAGMSIVHKVWHIYLFFGIIGLGVCIGGWVAGTTVINNWFIRKRPLALGLYVAAGGLGGFVFPPLATSLIAALGWRMTWLVLAGINLVLAAIVASLIMVKNKPEDIGQIPDGISKGMLQTAAVEHLIEAQEKPQWRPKQALRHYTIWLLAAYGIASYFALGVQQTHQIAYIQDLGFSPMVAATTVSIVSAFNILGGLGFGLIALKVNIRYLASTFLFLRMISLVILLASHNLNLIYIYAAIFGASLGVLSPVISTLIADYFGRDCYAPVLGVVMTAQILANAVSPTIAGAIYDATKTYTLAFILSIILTFIGLIFIFLARKPKLPSSDI